MAMRVFMAARIECIRLGRYPLRAIECCGKRQLQMARPATIPAAEFDAIFSARGWLAEQPAAFRSLILEESVQVRVSPGDCLVRRGDRSNGLYGVVAGAVGIEGGHGRQSQLLGHVLRAGDWFGIKAIFGGGPRELTYRAIEPTRLLFVDRPRLARMTRSDADIALRVGSLAEIGNRLGSWVARDLLTRDAGRRLAAVLLRALGSGDVAPADPSGFWLTHAQLAEMANLSRHHVGRKLASFEASGWIACGYNRIRLLDARALGAFAYADE
jgi:CRP-like cAMP-binding protein